MAANDERPPVVLATTMVEEDSIHQDLPSDNEEDDGLLPVSDTDATVSAGLKRQLYVSHFLSTWNSRFFEFGAVLFMVAIFPGTLLPVSLYAMIREASAIFLSPLLGGYIDRVNRLRVVRSSILGQRFAVALSCVAFLVLLMDALNTRAIRISSLIVLASLACVEQLCSILNLVAVERDWVVVIAAGNELELGVLNAQMRRIDLLCKLVGPVAIALIDGCSTKYAIFITLVLNVASVPVEYFCIARVYGMSPALQNGRSAATDHQTEHTAAGSRVHFLSLKLLVSNAKTAIKRVADYYHNPAFLPSLSYSILYFNMLAFGGPMVTYLLSTGFTSMSIGPVRGVSVLFELSSTWIAPAAVRRVGSVRAGFWFLNCQLLFLAIAVSLFWNLADPFLASLSLVVGVIASRVGLWGFTLAAQTIIQGLVESEQRGSFSTMEASVRHSFTLGSYATTSVFSQPDEFQYAALLSLSSVCVSAALYAKFVRQKRGHILHVPCSSSGHRMQKPSLEEGNSRVNNTVGDEAA